MNAYYADGVSHLGKQIRGLRKRIGLTQAQLAAQCGLSGNSMISRVESGAMLPSEALLSHLASALGVERDALALLSDDPGEAALAESELAALAADAGAARARLQALVSEVTAELETHHESLAAFVGASRLGLVWTLERKLRRERRARAVWVMTPDLGVDLALPQVLAVVRANIASGTRYRYLLPDTARMQRRAAKLRAALTPEGDVNETTATPAATAANGDTPGQGDLEIRVTDASAFDFALETVLYDPKDRARRLGLLVAPTRRREIDAVLDSEAASRFERAFTRRWRTARPVV
ncbi:MAG: helix-turn-helix transcriptional regulator [Myxococcales bacterium]|nr:helix-turn-helix transcriptional regulator [Myxococcales bacterium]